MVLKEINTTNYRIFHVLDKKIPSLFDRGQWWFHADELIILLKFGDKTSSDALIRYMGEGQAGFFPALIRGSRIWVSEQGLRNYCSKPRVSHKRKDTIGTLLELAAVFDRLAEKRPESPAATDESGVTKEPTPGAQDAGVSDDSDKTGAESVESDGKPEGVGEATLDPPTPPLECTPQTAAMLELTNALAVEEAKQAGERYAHDSFYGAVTGVLTTLVETDPQAAQAALLSFVRCNMALAANPHVGAYQLPGRTATSALAILNSILGKVGIPTLAPVFTDGVLTGFDLESTEPPEALSKTPDAPTDPVPRFPAQGAGLAYRPDGRVLP